MRAGRPPPWPRSRCYTPDMFQGPFAIAAYAYVASVVVLLIWEDRDPTTTLAWLLLLIFLPVVGIPLYLLFGRDWRWRRRRSRIARTLAELSAPVMARIDDAAATVPGPGGLSNDVAKVVHSVQAQGGAPPIAADSVEILASGADKFDRLLEDIASARDHVHLQYFIWESDELTGRVCDALATKLKAGVEVRLTYDLLGSLPYGKKQLRALKRAGARIEADARNINKLNYRNHRKIVVIDGTIGYTGGFNVGQEYVDGGRRFGSWRDTHLRITGPFVTLLQELFAQGWFESTRESLFADRYMPLPAPRDPETSVSLQLEHSSVESEWESIRQSYILALTNANERVWISTPYFVPDSGLYDALISTALAGLDVTLIMTGRPDKRIAFYAAHSYFRRLIEAGGRVFQYTDGFYHPKAVSIDGRYCSIGTANFDVRSLQLHRELTVWIYDERLTRRQDDLFLADLARSREVRLDEVLGYGPLVRFRNSLSRLAAKML